MGGHDLPPELESPGKAAKAIPLRDKEGKLYAELPWEDTRISLREIVIGESEVLRYRNIPQGVEVGSEESSITLSEREHETWVAEVAMPDIIISDYAAEVFTKTNLTS